MSINLRVLLVLGFLESGNSNSDVSISQTWVGEGRDITCILRGNENISQINWEIQQGRNRTILGIDNPDHGIHIMPEYKAQVELQGRPFPHSSSSLHIKRAVIKSICCIFITFPSGHLEKCMEIREEVTSINMSVIKGFTGVPEQKMGFFGHLGVIVIGTIGSLFILTFLFYICQKHNCARRKSFKIRTFQTQSTAEVRVFNSCKIND
ncbi:hypothetical protein DNTS_031036 [Danionella cerebrum]|uniref:Immunoglobulin V-set domain-containing protein n=1 Tax=Danionella cerebrum TaxID=2873325 RepID=A0A553MYM3_9TELE|nr:hypothetical protein DNTS_031036 [Danionella translucida]